MIRRIMVVRMIGRVVFRGLDVVTVSVIMQMISCGHFFRSNKINRFVGLCMNKGAKCCCQKHQQSEQSPIGFEAA